MGDTTGYSRRVLAVLRGPLEAAEFENLLRRYSQRPAGIGRPA